MLGGGGWLAATLHGGRLRPAAAGAAAAASQVLELVAVRLQRIWLYFQHGKASAAAASAV